jgi:nucleotide sugar dehydrogenase
MNVGIIGVGKLGLAYALVFEQLGHNVVASSYKQDYVDQLLKKQIDSPEPGIEESLKKSNIDFTIDNHHVINLCDIIYVMVATPSTPEGDYDVSAVDLVVQDFINHQGPVAGKILIVGSTVNPGNCQKIQELLNPFGVNVVYCPTFAAQGTVMRNIRDPKSLLLGTNNVEVAEQCRKLFIEVCGEDTPVHIVEPTTAEILKLAGNCKATLEISFFNMISQIVINAGLKHNLDQVDRYLNLVKTKQQWGHGFGFGGPCFPRDNRSMVHYANKLGIDFRLGNTIDEFNQQHVKFLTNYFLQDNINDLPYYFEYITYKPGVNILEESHQLKVCKKLLEAGKQVYVENTKFLLPFIIDELSAQYPNIEFVTLAEKNIPVYNVTAY